MGSERRQSPLAGNTVRRSWSDAPTPLEEMDTLDERPSYSARTARRYDSDPTFIAAPVAVPDDQAKTLRRDKNAAECDASGIFERPSYLPPAPSSLAPVAVDPKADNRYIDTVRTRQRERTIWKKKSDLLAARIAVFSGAFACVTVAALVWVFSNPTVTAVHASNASNAANAAALVDTMNAPPAVDLLQDTALEVRDERAHAITKAAERSH